MSDLRIPRWLFDRTSIEYQLLVIHTHSPRFIARWAHQLEVEDLEGPVIRIEGGWAAVPCQWIDPYESATFDLQDLASTLSDAWRLYNMPEPRIHPIYQLRGSVWTRDERLVVQRVHGQLAEPLGELDCWRGFVTFRDRPLSPIHRADGLLLVEEHENVGVPHEIIVHGIGPTMMSFKFENEPRSCTVDY